MSARDTASRAKLNASAGLVRSALAIHLPPRPLGDRQFRASRQAGLDSDMRDAFVRNAIPQVGIARDLHSADQHGGALHKTASLMNSDAG